MGSLLQRLVAAAVLAAATVVLLPSAPAHAAACPGATGVTVIVDYKQLGGGIAKGCAATGGGKTATVNFPAAGYPLAFVQRSPGFVCRVSAKPAADPCVNTPPATAYWSLWWSDGKSGKWTYSTLGAGSLKVATGGYLAFSWQGQAAKAAPGAAPTKRVGLAAAASSPSSAPTRSPQNNKGDKSRNNDASPPVADAEPSASAEPTPAQTASPSAAKSATAGKTKKSKKDKKDRQATTSPTASESADTGPAVESTGQDDEAAAAASAPAEAQAGTAGRVPWWVSMPLLLVLIGGIAGVTVWRGRRTPSA